MLNTWLRKGLFAMLLLMVLLATGYQFKEKVLQSVANYFLQDFQTRIHLAEPFELSWQSVFFPSIQINYSGEVQDLSAVSVRWAGFKLTGVHIDKVRLELPENKGQQRAVNPRELIDKYEQWRQLPALEVVIQELDLRDKQYEIKLKHKPISDSLNVRLEKFELQLAASTQQNLPYFEYQINQNSKGLLSGKLSVIGEQGWKLAGSQQLSSVGLWPLLKDYVSLPEALESVSGRLNLSFDIRLDTEQLHNSELKLALEQDTLIKLAHKYSQQQARLYLAKGARFNWHQGQTKLFVPAVSVEQSAPALSVSAEQLTCDTDFFCQLRIKARAEVTANWLTQHWPVAIDFDRLETEFEGPVLLSPAKAGFKLEQTANLTVHNLNYQDVQVSSLPLVLSGFEFDAEFEDLNWHMAAELVTTEVKELTLDELKLSSLLNISKVKANSSGQAFAQVNAEQLVIQYQGIPLPPLFLSSELDINQERAGLDALVQDQWQEVVISAQSQYQLDSKTARFEAGLKPVDISHLQNHWFKRLPQWPKNLSFLSGEVTAKSEFQWVVQQQWSGSFQLDADQVSGVYADSGFQQLDLSLPGYIDPLGTVSAGRAEVKVGLLDIGIPLEQIFLSADWNGTERSVLVHQAKANILGGSISTADVNYRHGQESELGVQLEGLKLQQMLELVNNRAIRGEASISGYLPLLISGKRVYMDAGKLGADGKGFIQYQAETQQTAQLDPALKLVNDALSNYHFDTLLSRASYDQQGELLLNMKLTGANPDMNNGQKINLNLNLSNNIPQMLKSLQLGRDITQVIEKQYNKEQ